MKVITELNYEVTVKAVLRDEELSLSMTATAPYGNRKVTATVEGFSEKATEAVRKALKAVMDEKVNEAVQAAQIAAAEAHVIAAKRGEM